MKTPVSFSQLKKKVSSKRKGAVLFILTPEIAEYLISIGAKTNQNPSKERVNWYAQKIKNGQWEFNGEDIKVNSSANYLDGQHRCLAVIKAGIPIESVLFYGYERK